MISALLVDLDGTLLENRMDVFLPAYLELLGQFIEAQTNLKGFIRQLLRSTEEMLGNQDPLSTLEEAFASSMYPALGVDAEDMRPLLEAFYRDHFPELRKLTAPIPGANALIQFAKREKLEIVIATNPLFPRTAIIQRLEWAGLGSEIDNFTLVTTYEAFHNAKPSPSYYAEILGRLGRGPGEAAMIGDDCENDIQPASVLGVCGFHMAPSGISQHAPSAGPLDQSIIWIERLKQQPEYPQTLSPQAALARLHGQLSALDAFTRLLPEDLWHLRPQPREWAPVEIIAHLRDVELEVNLPRIEAMLNQAAPFVPAADPDQWAEQRGYHRQDGPQAMADFASARMRTLAILKSLPDEAWARSALHAIFGPTSLLEIMMLAADHDLLHLRQLRSSLTP
jgi:HAD superfamily hydrolase (TIGR01549 family)